MADIGRFAAGWASTVAVSALAAVPLPAVVGIVALDWDGAVDPGAISTVVDAPAWADTASSSVVADRWSVEAAAAAVVVGVVSLWAPDRV